MTTTNPASLFLPLSVEGIEPLINLALDLRWSWNHCADAIWEQLDPDLWELTHNPWVVLKTVSREKLKEKLSNPAFAQQINSLVQRMKKEAADPAWFQKKHPQSPVSCIAYLSMEFMLSEALPIYSGGLGNVAGDQLKAASDLGLPVVAVGILYQQGYFRQVIDKDGTQQAFYPYNSPEQLPITPVRKPNGEWLRLEVLFPGYSVWIRTWQVDVGRVKLYLLDSNDAANFPVYRGITSELYGGGPDQRLKQELLLGLGGWRLLRELGLNPEVCHLNEGHAAFAILERAKYYMKETGSSFETALAVTKAGNLFTTHTAVAAGFDRFQPALIQQYLEPYANNQLGIPLKDLLALGRLNPNDDNEPFNMAYLAVRGSGAINAVSELHGKVSRKIFAPLFPRWPENEVPIGHVTNGVHMPSWDSEASDVLWTTSCGKNRWHGETEELEDNIRSQPDEMFWKMRTLERKRLIEFTRIRHSRQQAVRGMPLSDIEKAKLIFDPNVLTLGFARRFATYKRPNMLLYDRERLLRILSNPDKPVQLIIAGKAHPADKPGQEMIKQWMHFICREDVRPHIVFLSDYDMQLTERLVQGVDVWINTPRRPWEACGTSGMKILVNGGLNLSELDGWWAEAYSPEVGWAIGDGKEHGDDPAWDAAEANKLYELLENEIVPLFYNRNKDGLPTGWIAKMRESMARLTPQYSANRAVREYTEKYYLPAAENYRDRAANKGEAGKKVLDTKTDLRKMWLGISFGAINVAVNGNQYEFTAQLNLNQIDPNMISVELFANGLNGSGDVRHEMKLLKKQGAVSVYSVKVPKDRSEKDYTARVIPKLKDVSVPLEASEILWQR